MFCALSDLRTESDVEQKLIYPMLTGAFPLGCGFVAADIFTKENVRHFDIDKGRTGKIYRPDYILVLNGLPVAAIEAKKPDEDVDEGLREARLYATEINAIYPSNINPCIRVFACNGKRLVSSPWDQHTPDIDIPFEAVLPTNVNYHKLVSCLSKQVLIEDADKIARRLKIENYWRAIDLLGGVTARDEEIGYNSFGRELAFEFEHIFNPTTAKQRSHIVHNAYVKSQRRRHYADEIERVVYRAIPSTSRRGQTISDTGSPTELLRVLGRGKELQNKVMLLVGAVGSGKSTFIDYFREVKMSPELRGQTVWVHVDVNDTPPTGELLEQWVAGQIHQGLRSSEQGVDFDDPMIVKKVYNAELNTLEKRVLSFLPKNSSKRDESIAAKIQELDSDIQASTKALSRYLCGDRNRLLVVVMDNCDKGDADEQLKVFQLVRWVQSWLSCLVFLPIRDVTYELYQKKPPLDTVIKDYVFRIEPPPFTSVLRKRIDLTLAELNRRPTNQVLSYRLQNGMEVRYPASDLGMYLGCLYKSIFEHDALLRKMLMGLADRNIRRAIEIFIEFCKSGHISEHHILCIRLAKGDYALPFSVVMRVLLRLNRRFYDGDSAIIKNLFQSNPDCSSPSNFPRFAILLWLELMWDLEGPTGVKGFHRIENMLRELAPLGMDARQVMVDLRYLVEAGCVATEHQRREVLSDGDLISLSASGRAHLRLVRNTEYLSACSEDAWIGDERFVREVATRIGRRTARTHYADISQAKNAEGLTRYLTGDDVLGRSVGKVLYNAPINLTSAVNEMHAAAEKRLLYLRERHGWKDANARFPSGTVCDGRIRGIAAFGLFVQVIGGPQGMLHSNDLPPGKSINDFKKGDSVRVKVLSVDDSNERLQLALA
jgi:hypothetical protein